MNRRDSKTLIENEKSHLYETLGPSRYFTSHLKGFRLPSSQTGSSFTFPDLSSELVTRGNGKRIKDWKAHLNLLRELTVYLNVRDVVPIELVESISQTLQSITEGQVNADVSKKIYRVSCHILQVSKLLIIIHLQYTYR